MLQLFKSILHIHCVLEDFDNMLKSGWKTRPHEKHVSSRQSWISIYIFMQLPSSLFNWRKAFAFLRLVARIEAIRVSTLLTRVQVAAFEVP